jgi:pimeloyl-ACP methyl ester carboxylesterase
MESLVPFPSDDYSFIQHRDLASSADFHWDDVPEEVLQVDDDLSVPTPRIIGHAAITMGIAAEDARKVRVPVFICLGEKDVSPGPHDEPGSYTASSDVTLFVLPKSGHCQSFASTRLLLADRIDGWLRGLS